MSDDVGTSGEFAPEILFRLRNTPFIKKVEEWLHRFDFSGEILVKSMGEGAFSLYVGKTRGGLSVNFADTGFGLSQVLPLIVQGFFSTGPSDLLVAEQPEIHLNPKLQSTLGDLFCAVAKGGSSILIETHSEHLVLRLQVNSLRDSLRPRTWPLLHRKSDGGRSSFVRYRSSQMGTFSRLTGLKGFSATFKRRACVGKCSV
jgi:predicted ATPase